MAEIRKHKPSTSAIARAIEEAMGPVVRPVVPGSSPEPDEPAASNRSVQQGPSTAATWQQFVVPRPPARTDRASGTEDLSPDSSPEGH